MTIVSFSSWVFRVFMMTNLNTHFDQARLILATALGPVSRISAGNWRDNYVHGQNKHKVARLSSYKSSEFVFLFTFLPSYHWHCWFTQRIWSSIVLMTTIQLIHVQHLGPKCEGQADVRIEMSEEETHLRHTTTRTHLLREENHVSSKLALHLQVRERIISHKMPRRTNISCSLLLCRRIQIRRRAWPHFLHVSLVGPAMDDWNVETL